MKKCYQIIVSGIVQGVYFRKSTEQKAKELGLKGFVQNESNGSVYIEIEGSEDNSKQFIKWCSQGPERAVVNKVEVEEIENAGFNIFEIRR